MIFKVLMWQDLSFEGQVAVEAYFPDCEGFSVLCRIVWPKWLKYLKSQKHFEAEETLETLTSTTKKILESERPRRILV